MTARMQVLYLPSISDGDRHEPRYALVVDQAAELAEPDRDALRAFATEAGAQGAVVLSGTVDLAQDDGSDEETAEALGGLLREALTVPTGPAGNPSASQKPNLPPPNTTEGKLARVYGGRKILDELENDPR